MSSFTEADIDRAVAAERQRCAAIMSLPSNPAKETGLMRQCLSQGMSIEAADQWFRGAPERMARAGGMEAATGSTFEDTGGGDAVAASWNRAFGAAKE